MSTILQDMMGMLKRNGTVIPKADNYITVARYPNPQERLKPQPKLQTELVTLAQLKTFYNTGLSYLPLSGGTISGDLNVTGKIDLTTASEGVVFTAPNGTRWKQTISNAGAPVYTEL
jgi:hypothetical protein